VTHATHLSITRSLADPRVIPRKSAVKCFSDRFSDYRNPATKRDHRMSDPAILTPLLPPTRSRAAVSFGRSLLKSELENLRVATAQNTIRHTQGDAKREAAPAATLGKELVRTA
jgi:hypothetical protein